MIDQLDDLISKLNHFLKDGVSPSATDLLTKDQQKTICLVYLRAKRNLVEKDLYSFQKEAFRVNAKL